MLTNKRAKIIASFLIIFIILIDQLTKAIAFDYLNLHNLHAVKIYDFFSLVKVWNFGISFGLFHDFYWSNYLFLGINIIITCALLIWMYRTTQKGVIYALSMINGGALSNLVDRFYHGGVADFIDLHIGNIHWPAFNLADTTISIGAIYLILKNYNIHEKKLKHSQEDRLEEEKSIIENRKNYIDFS